MWWQEPITKLKGIGPKKAADFANLNIFTIGDLLNRYPRTYVDQSKVKTIAELATDGEKQLFCAEVYRVADRISARRMRYTLVTLKDATGCVFRRAILSRARSFWWTARCSRGAAQKW